jgi:hypothetical protein
MTSLWYATRSHKNKGNEFSTLLIIQSFRPDWFFSTEQQQRLSDLMNLWRTARDHRQSLPPEQQAELDSLVEAELKAATARTEQQLWCSNEEA